MQRRWLIGLILILGAILLGCTQEKNSVNTSSKQSNEPQKVEFLLNKTLFEIKPWKTDNSHVTFVEGKLSVDGKPVKGAIIQSNTRKIETDVNGKFKLFIDQSKIQRVSVKFYPLPLQPCLESKLVKLCKKSYYPNHRKFKYIIRLK
jgi:hypothetical protein